jgi:hypothetical protein
MLTLKSTPYAGRHVDVLCYSPTGQFTLYSSEQNVEFTIDLGDFTAEDLHALVRTLTQKQASVAIVSKAFSASTASVVSGCSISIDVQGRLLIEDHEEETHAFTYIGFFCPNELATLAERILAQEAWGLYPDQCR